MNILILENKTFFLIKKFLIIFFVLGFLFFFFVENAFSGPSDRIKGFAWTDNIGWISYNCTDKSSCSSVDYGVNVLASGEVVGFAWADHIGWIDFSYYGDANLDLATGRLTGRAQALSALIDPSDGWDGVVYLAEATPVSYGPILNLTNYKFDGYSWGDTVIGWIDYQTPVSVVTYDPFFFSLTANRGLTAADKVPHGGNVTLNWQTTGAVSCSASGPSWSGPKPVGEPSSSSETISGLTADSAFTLTCLDSSGHSISRTVNILVSTPSPVVTITADDTNIASGSSTTLRWNAQNVSSCTASGFWSGSKATGSSSESTGSLTSLNNLFTLTCSSSDPAHAPATDSVLVNVEKLVVSFYAQDNKVLFNDPVVLRFSSEFADSCVASGDWSGAQSVAAGLHTHTTPNITTAGATFTYHLTCSKGTDSVTKSVTVEIGKNPEFKET